MQENAKADDKTAITSTFWNYICISIGFQPVQYFLGLCLWSKFRWDPHQDPCQVCGFHRVAQHQALRMCVKSLLDRWWQPQRLPLILQRSRQNHTAASAAVCCVTYAKQRGWNGQQQKTWKICALLCEWEMYPPAVPLPQNCCQELTAVSRGVGSDCICYVHTAS